MNYQECVAALMILNNIEKIIIKGLISQYPNNRKDVTTRWSDILLVCENEFSLYSFGYSMH